MDRPLFLLIAMVVGYAGPAVALDSADFQAKTTRNLVNLCSATWGDEDYQAAMGFCLGYLDATQDYHRTISSGDLVKPISCPKGPVTRQQLLEVFLAWAKSNPGLLDGEAPIHGVMRAASAEWPCAQ
jgi:hypothetical protein